MGTSHTNHRARHEPIGEAQPDHLSRSIDATQMQPYQSARRLLAEFLGTFALTFVAAGGPTIATATGTNEGLPALVVAPGLMVMAAIYTLGPLSGAHINPAVSLAFALRHNFPWAWVPGYWIAQLAGAYAAGLLLHILFGAALASGVTVPHPAPITALVLETLLTFFLVTVILATAANFRLVGHNAAIAVGATVALDGLFAAPVSGASMNPARSFGPALASGHLTNLWIYIAGPLAGAVLAVAVAWMLRGPGSVHGEKAATGDG